MIITIRSGKLAGRSGRAGVQSALDFFADLL